MNYMTKMILNGIGLRNPSMIKKTRIREGYEFF